MCVQFCGEGAGEDLPLPSIFFSSPPPVYAKWFDKKLERIQVQQADFEVRLSLETSTSALIQALDVRGIVHIILKNLTNRLYFQTTHSC